MSLSTPFLPKHRIESTRLILEPLSNENARWLAAATVPEPEIFQYLHLDIGQPGQFDRWIDDAVTRMAEGTALHFVLSLRETQTVIGHTAVVGIRPADRRCEVAWTWLLRRFQGNGLALESKKAVYSFLFAAGMKRVQLLADERNTQSIKSIERSGAVREGVLRCNRMTLDGSWQNTVVMSILDEEWSALQSVDHVVPTRR